MKRGLVIKSPWIEYILEGKKTWELRGSNTKIRGTIYLIKSGSGMIYGQAELIDCKPLSFDDLKKNTRKHRVPMEGVTKPFYPSTHAWVLKDAKKFDKPIPYKHPMGAVIWVNLGEENDKR